MLNIKELYKQHCLEHSIEFQDKELTVKPYNDSTLFCPAGIQQFNQLIKTEFKGTFANIQPCIRLNDLVEIGDGSHLLYFNMIGLFSFRELTLQQAIDFWMSFIVNKLGLTLSKITVHPDKKEWRELYSKYQEYYLVKLDEECFWTDGVSEGYCTEFYVEYLGKDLEIGNIVNPNGDSIDVGFGFERNQMVANSITYTKEETLINTITELLKAGYTPTNKQQGYVTRKLIRLWYKEFGISLKNNRRAINDYYVNSLKNQITSIETYIAIILKEIEVYERAKENYLLNKDKAKFKDKTAEWWFDTFGINPNDL